VATREEISRAPASGAAPPDADPDRRRERSTRRQRFLTVDISVHRTFGEVSLTENSYSQHSCFTCSTLSDAVVDPPPVTCQRMLIDARRR
jgi:hypothetical protein